MKRDANEYTLIEAVSIGDMNKFKQLLDSGVDVDVVDSHGNTALWRAVYDYRGDGTFIELLLSKGADPNHKNNVGKSPKELAHMIANYDVAKYFQESS